MTAMRILVTGTNRPCHERLRRDGHDLVLFLPRGSAKPADLGAYEQLVLLDDEADAGTWVDIAEACHKGQPFDAVTAYHEQAYPLAVAIADRLGITSLIDLALLDRLRDKAVMRDVLAGHGVPSCRYARARGEAEVRVAVERIGVPCIVKPRDGEGSHGVTKIDTPADIGPALARIGRPALERGVLVEEFLAGEEVSVEAISGAHRHHILAVTKKYKDDQTFIEQGHLVPAPLDDAVRADIERYVDGALTALGVHDCPSHTEVMLTQQGPRIIETHSRVGGDRIVELVHLATGADLYDLVARQSIGQDIAPLLAAYGDGDRHRSAAVWYAAPSGPPTHRLYQVGGVEQARALPGVDRVEILRAEGSRAGEVRESADRSALAIAVADAPGEALARAREAVRMLRFRYVWAAGDAPGSDRLSPVAGG